jgi:hypothetical protein
MPHPLSGLVQLWREFIKGDFEKLGYLSLEHKDRLEAEAQALGFETGRGTTRVVILQKSWVVKLPTNLEGIEANRKEAYSFGIPVARSRLLGDILVMERVEHHHESWKDLPSWCGRIVHEVEIRSIKPNESDQTNGR